MIWLNRMVMMVGIIIWKAHISAAHMQKFLAQQGLDDREIMHDWTSMHDSVSRHDNWNSRQCGIHAQIGATELNDKYPFTKRTKEEQQEMVIQMNPVVM